MLLVWCSRIAWLHVNHPPPGMRRQTAALRAGGVFPKAAVN